jgi:hypothetical protein
MLATACLTLLLLAQPGPDAPDEPEDKPSLVGLPPGHLFCGAKGRFTLTAAVAPTEVRVGEPVTLTLTFTATRAGRLPPERLTAEQLHTLPGLGKEDFDIDPPRPEDTRTRRRWYRKRPGPGDKRPGPGDVYEFVYRLRPKRPDVTAVPSLPLVFWDPDIFSSDNARHFQACPTEAVSLRVLPPERYATPLVAPEVIFRHAAGPEVLERRSPRGLPGVGVVLLALLGPPLLCLGWYRLWRRLWPDAERLARLRRSRAAAAALEALHGLNRAPAEQRADLAAAAVALYLRERLDLAVAEPTPQETAAHLEAVGCPAPLTRRARTFFAACDAARFGAAAPDDLSGPGVELIAAVEEEACRPPS